MKKLSLILAILMIISCLFVGCGPKAEPDNGDVSTTTSTTAGTDGEVPGGEGGDATTVPSDEDATTSATEGDTTESTDADTAQSTGKTTVKTTAKDPTPTKAPTKAPSKSTTKGKNNTKTTAAKLPGQDKLNDKVEELSTYQFPKRSGVTGKIRVFIPWDVDARYTRLKKEFEAAYPGTEIEYITSPWNTRNTKLANQVKAKKYVDCVSAFYSDFPDRAIKNLVQPMDEYLVMGDSLNKNVMETVTSYDGKHYAMMRSAYPYVIYYNADMFDEFGEKTPLEYYKAGKWNWNTFRTVAANMTDVQNGKVKTYGFGIDDETIFLLSAGTDAITFKDGKPVLNVNNPKFTSSMDFFYKMCNTDKSVYAERWLNFNAFLEEKTAMSYWRADADSIDRLKEAKINWEIVPFPKAEGAKDYYGTALGDGWSLGVNCANPVGGMAFAEFEINDRAKLNEKIAFSASQKKMLGGIVSTVSYINCYGMDISFNNGFCNAMRNNGSMSAKLEEYIPEWNMLIDDMINGR